MDSVALMSVCVNAQADLGLQSQHTCLKTLFPHGTSHLFPVITTNNRVFEYSIEYQSTPYRGNTRVFGNKQLGTSNQEPF